MLEIESTETWGNGPKEKHVAGRSWEAGSELKLNEDIFVGSDGGGSLEGGKGWGSLVEGRGGGGGGCLGGWRGV